MQYTEEELNITADAILQKLKGEEIDPALQEKYPWDEEMMRQVEPILEKRIQKYQRVREWLWQHCDTHGSCELYTIEAARHREIKRNREQLKKLIEKSIFIFDSEEQFLKDVVLPKCEEYDAFTIGQNVMVAIGNFERAMDYLSAAQRALKTEND